MLPGFYERENNVRESHVVVQITDNGGRRSGIDLRQFSYTDHIPERRADQDRRCGLDRRSGLERRTCEDRRCGIDKRTERKGGEKIIEMRKYKERRSSSNRRAAAFG